jgi:hypothetical protein
MDKIAIMLQKGGFGDKVLKESGFSAVKQTVNSAITLRCATIYSVTYTTVKGEKREVIIIDAPERQSDDEIMSGMFSTTKSEVVQLFRDNDPVPTQKTMKNLKMKIEMSQHIVENITEIGKGKTAEHYNYDIDNMLSKPISNDDIENYKTYAQHLLRESLFINVMIKQMIQSLKREKTQESVAFNPMDYYDNTTNSVKGIIVVPYYVKSQDQRPHVQQETLDLVNLFSDTNVSASA